MPNRQEISAAAQIMGLTAEEEKLVRALREREDRCTECGKNTWEKHDPRCTWGH